MLWPLMITVTAPQPPAWLVTSARAGPDRVARKVSSMLCPKSAGQLKAPGGNSGRPSTAAAILATLAGSVTVTGRSAAGSGLDPAIGVMVTTFAVAGIRSPAGFGGSQV